MHQPVVGRLEEYLQSREPMPEVEAHLRHCAECRNEVEQMRAQAELFHLLKAPAEMEPAPGMYARVMNQIEAQGKPSVWNLFGESLFAKRLAYTSMTFLVLLGTYMMSSQSNDDSVASRAPEAILAGDHQAGLPVGNDQQSDREAVLVNLATYHQDYQ